MPAEALWTLGGLRGGRVSFLSGGRWPLVVNHSPADRRTCKGIRAAQWLKKREGIKLGVNEEAVKVDL